MIYVVPVRLRAEWYEIETSGSAMLTLVVQEINGPRANNRYTERWLKEQEIEYTMIKNLYADFVTAQVHGYARLDGEFIYFTGKE